MRLSPPGVAKCEELKRELQTQGIDWHWLRYHQRPSLPATIYDVIAGALKAGSLVQRKKIEMVHARGHIPATIALALKTRFGIKMIFDLRGLMAEEYVDAGHWRKGSVPYRLTKSTERRILAETDAVVTLTERIWPIIREWDGLRGRTPHHEVIPCCVDLARFRFSDEERTRRRRELGLEDQFTVVYSGSLDGWYLTEKMADFFASLVRRNPASAPPVAHDGQSRSRTRADEQPQDRDEQLQCLVGCSSGCSFVSCCGGCGAFVYQTLCVEGCVVADKER